MYDEEQEFVGYDSGSNFLNDFYTNELTAEKNEDDIDFYTTEFLKSNHIKQRDVKNKRKVKKIRWLKHEMFDY